MNLRSLTLATLVSLCCATAAEGQTAAQQLMKADREFATATASHGVDAWVAAFADDGIQIDEGGITKGSAAIRQLMTGPLSDKKTYLDWQPVSAEAGASNDLGYTIGKWQVRLRAKPDSVLQHGNYVTIWRKQKDGSWKAAVDIGNSEK